MDGKTATNFLNFMYLVSKLHPKVEVRAFDGMSHLAFIILNIISGRRFFLFDVLSRSAFIIFARMSFRHYLPFNVFVLSTFFTFQRFFCRPFVSLTLFIVGVFYFYILSVNHYLGGKNMKRMREKRGQCERKRRKDKN